MKYFYIFCYPMSQYFQPYKYFNGEKSNPYDAVNQNPQFMFWSYEEGFNTQFERGDFSLEGWEPIAPDEATLKDLKNVLAADPVDKEELFKLYMFHILMVHLPDRAIEPPSNKYLKLYENPITE